ncbi:MAG TPA: TonB-dependent receptor [Steroidobacteraceae bacterium]|nr:TonB-dependent receptor [Steroidobacteraceae bacterium]
MLRDTLRRLLGSEVKADWIGRYGVPALAVSTSLFTPIALAAENASSVSGGDVEEVVVTGLRQALKTSQEIKREADTVVDSITASDIGVFPDHSVAEALQRVTGVTVTRFAAASDTTHFSAEPSGVVIRGLPQVRSEFNGRDSFNANSSRGLSFADVPPELMAGVDTYKNLTADMIEGGIAGTVNLRTHVPFDSEGFVAAFSGNLGYGDLTEDVKPGASALVSDRWQTGIGEFGLMGNVAYSEVSTESQGVQVGRYYRVENVADYGGGTKWIPGGIDIRDTVYERTRTGAAFAAQWRSPDESLLATLQYNRSKYVNKFDEFSLTAGVGNSQTAQDLELTSPLAFAPDGTDPYEFDSRGVFTRGVIADSSNSWAGPNNNPALSHPGGYTTDNGQGGTFPNWYCYSWSLTGGATCPSTRGIGLSADTRYATTTDRTQDTSINLKWTPNDRLGIALDLQYIKSNVDNFDNSADNKTATDLNLDLTGSRPKFSFGLPSGFGFTSGGFSDPANYYHEWEMEHIEESEGTEKAGRLDFDIDLGDGWMDALRVGVRRAEREQDINWSTYNWGSVQPLWGVQNDVGFFLDQSPWQNTYETHDLGSDLVGGGIFGGGTYVHPSRDIVKNYQRTIDAFGNGNSNSWVPLAQRTTCPVVQGTVFCPVEQQVISEDVDAAYVMLKFGGDDTKLGPISVKGNIGVRYVITKVEASGGAAFPLFTQPSPPSGGSPPDPLLFTPQDDITFMNGGTYQASDGDKNHNILPSLNVRFGLTDDMYLRFAASRALARPDMGLYKNYYSISRDKADCTTGTVTYAEPGNCQSFPVAYTPRYSAEVGNPRLKPTTADQLDLSYEWYFSDTGSFTAALFYKKFDNYLTSASYLKEFTNNGVTRTVGVTSPVNGDGGKIQGFEVAYQTFFDMLPSPWDGFGIQANFTYVDNQGVKNSNLASTSGAGSTVQDPLITFTDLPLEGYSKRAYNLVAMYDKGKFSARLAYNWRDKYLVSQADCCIKLPIWQDAYGQLDGSVHFKPSDTVDIFLESQNLTKSETVLKQQVTQDGMLLPRSWFTNDRRFQVGVRFSIR